MHTSNFPNLQSMRLGAKLRNHFGDEFLAIRGITIDGVGRVLRGDNILTDDGPEDDVLQELREMVRDRKRELGLYLPWATDD